MKSCSDMYSYKMWGFVCLFVCLFGVMLLDTGVKIDFFIIRKRFFHQHDL
jgi:hypothetical protein